MGWVAMIDANLIALISVMIVLISAEALSRTNIEQQSGSKCDAANAAVIRTKDNQIHRQQDECDEVQHGAGIIGGDKDARRWAKPFQKKTRKHARVT